MLHDLTLYQKSYEFLFWIKQVVQKFAKAHKYALGIQLENEMLELVKAIVRANRAWDKRPYIEECFVRYETVRILVRACKDFKLITVRQYEFASEKLAEIGRLLGGWQKYSAGGGQIPCRDASPYGGSRHGICSPHGREQRGAYRETGGFIRGGNWDNGANSGAFTLNLNNAPSNSNTNIGFRCARFSGEKHMVDTVCWPESYAPWRVRACQRQNPRYASIP